MAQRRKGVKANGKICKKYYGIIIGQGKVKRSMNSKTAVPVISGLFIGS